ncbi:hypothetical protein FRC04_004908 [Tulasnella sp. 424]|nr:hypothetical protein FRC04_004908 [Tulasnella sp. 424]
MAFSTIDSSGQPAFFENLIHANRVAAPIFSLRLARHQTTGPTLCLGGYNYPKAVGFVTWVPVTSMTYLAVSMAATQVNGHLVTMSKSITAAIDSGTTPIYVSQDIASAIYRQIPNAQRADQNLFASNPVDFNLGKTGFGSPTCVSGVGMGDSFPDELTIVEDEFLKSWYPIYDYSHGARVGLAPSVNNYA